MMQLPERKALLWFRKHEPADWPQHADQDCPSQKIFDRLIRAALIEVDPKRTRFGPLQFVLSDEGREALEL